jgi:hypothetical protein
MIFVYATRLLPKLEFGTANKREAIPNEADVYAVCDGALTIRQQDSQAFGTMTLEEQHTLETIITQSQRAEAVRAYPASNGDHDLLSRLRRLLDR